MGRWGRPRLVVLAALLVLAATVISGSRVWLRGTSAESGLAGGVVTATGAQAVPGLVALGLVIGAATVAAAAGGRVVRRVTLVVAILAASGLAFAVVRGVNTADATLGRLAADASGRAGVVPVSAQVSAWPWLVVVAAIVACTALVAGLVGSGSWRGLSQRYEAPGVSDVTGPRGQRVTGDWERLDLGEDPTLAGAPTGTKGGPVRHLERAPKRSRGGEPAREHDREPVAEGTWASRDVKNISAQGWCAARSTHARILLVPIVIRA